MFLLLLGPAPISLILFLLGEGPVALTVVLAATAGLVGLLLELYRRQRRDAPRCGLPLLPPSQVIAMLVLLAGIGLGVFFLPSPTLAHLGFLCVTLVIALCYIVSGWIRPTLSEPDERCLVLVLALMASLIALANAFV